MKSPLQHADDPLPSRGRRGPGTAGAFSFCGLRALDPLLQYSLLAPLSSALSIFSAFGSSTSAPSLAWGASPALDSLSINLNLSPAATVLFSMSILSALRQIYWHLFISLEPLPAGFDGAAGFAAFNTFCNTLNTLLYVYFATKNPTWSTSVLLASAAGYVVGAFLETATDQQLGWFRKDPNNKGKPHSGGLSSLARHMNYTGYIIWRIAYGVAGGGLLAAGFYVPWFLFVFVTISVPTLEHYLVKKYGDSYKKIQEQTPWKLFPYIW
jgi:protein-S-isoprenylcysteine O-methyltransferase Ste14